MSAYPDQNIFESSNVAVNVAAGASELENRIGDELARAVIGRSSSTTHTKYRHPALAIGAKQIRRLGTASQGVHRVMSEQQEIVSLVAGDFSRNELFLQMKCGAVLNAAAVNYNEGHPSPS
jgi:hypothetical protein